MSKIRRIGICLLSLSLILISAATIPNPVSAHEVVSLDPLTFSGQRLPDTTLSCLSGKGGFTLIQFNSSTGANNTQVSNMNGTTWTSQGTQTKQLDPNTTQALQTIISLFKSSSFKK
jgi:hypothetical protein